MAYMPHMGYKQVVDNAYGAGERFCYAALLHWELLRREEIYFVSSAAIIEQRSTCRHRMTVSASGSCHPV